MTTTACRTAADIASRMTEAAAAWLGSLEDGQRAKALLSFDDAAERTSWAYFPRMTKGLPLLEMEARQQKLAHALIAGALSFDAYAKVVTVMASESLVNLREGSRLDAFRDPRRYFLAIFGLPGNDPWGWRFEGHHVVLNFTLAGEIVSPTPIFIGAQPAEVPHGHSMVLRPCAEEEDAARELLRALDGDQRGQAIISDIAPPDFVIMNSPVVPESALPGDIEAPPLLASIVAEAKAIPSQQRQALRFERARPKGLPGAAMDASQRKLVSELIDVYADRLPGPLSAIERERIERAGIDGDQRGQAIISDIAPPDFVIMNSPVVPESALPGDIEAPPLLASIVAEAKAMPSQQREALRFERIRPRGLPASAMDGGQRKLLSELTGVYVERLPGPLSAIERERIERAGIDGVHFAWAGETERRRPHYYRLQGPSFLVEYDNTQNDVNHVHSVWRDPDRDFGGDLLREHVRSSH